MTRLFLCGIMIFLVVMVVGFSGLDEISIALYNLVCLCYNTSTWGKAVLVICGVLTVVCFAVEE